jgi:flagellar secretion chaperone FliS
MNARAGDQYLRGAVLTASPEQLQLMLYDGAIRFATQARESLQARDIEQTHNHLVRAQRIIVELQNGLRPDAAPEICSQMAGLYAFVYRRLVEANLQKDLAALDEALQILNHMRQTWLMLMDKLQQERSGSAPGTATIPRQMAAVPVEVGSFSAEG